MVTGREDEHQRPVPKAVRDLVPARYGVEIVLQDGELWLIISDQLRNRFAQTRWTEDYPLLGEELGPRIVFPSIFALKNQRSIKAA